MIPDLGKYAASVLGAYGASLTLLLVLVVVSIWQGARLKRALDEAEARARSQAGDDGIGDA